MSEDYTPSNLVDWRYRIKNKQLYQIKETASHEDFQQQQQLKWLAHEMQRENNNNQDVDIPHYFR